MHITDLGGHSGCKIILIENDDNTVFVRKISSSIDYNKRLETQALKQESYKADKVKVPRVLHSGINKEGLFYFDMEYIQGITLAEYVQTIEIGKIRNLVNNIVSNIVCVERDGEVKTEVFIKKIDLLKKNLAAHKNSIINNALELLEKHNWYAFRETFCHGDLTLENIIVKDNQLYLIDFLDSFYNCWIMDISTLLQDVQTLWSYRFQDELDINTIIRLIVFRDLIMDKVKELVGKQYIEVYYALLLKLIRIYPYAKDRRTYCFLNEKTNSIMNIIKEEEK